MLETIWYGVSSLVFGIVLFFPLRKLMLAMSINRQQRKLNRELTDEEREILRRKLTILAAALAITFAFFYNKYLFFRLLPQR
jgi:AmiR/NasT family two-component response regulator